MEFSDTKCEVLWISRSKTLIHRTYYLHATPLREVDGARNQGIWFSKDLKWNRSIDEITAKAYRTFGFLKRNLQENLSTLKAKAYKGLVRPQTVTSRPSLRLPGCSSLLTLMGFCALSHTGHVTRTRKVSFP